MYSPTTALITAAFPVPPNTSTSTKAMAALV